MRVPFSFMKSGGAPAFDPSSVSGLAAWYDLTVCTVGAGKVTALPDQSGNARNATLTGAGHVYTATNAAYNNRPTVNHADATDVITAPNLGVTTGPLTYVFVGDVPVDMLTYLTYGASGPLARNYTTQWQATVNGVDVIGATSTTAASVLIFVLNGASSKVYVNSLTAAASGTIGTQPDLTGLGMPIGVSTAANGYGDFNFTHALFYNGALSDSDCGYLLSGFGTQSGITIAP